MLNTRLESIFESVMQRTSATLMEVIRPQARRVYRELEEARTAHESLVEAVERMRTEHADRLHRLNSELGQASRLARRLDRAARDMHYYEVAQDAHARNFNDASNGDWEWQRYL